MKSDVEIAQEATLSHISEIATQLDLTEDDLELYGKYKAKISIDAWNRIKNNENGKSKYVYSSIDKLQDSGKKAGDFDAKFCKKRK